MFKDGVLQADTCCGEAAAHICVVHSSYTEWCSTASYASPCGLAAFSSFVCGTLQSHDILNAIT